MASKRVSIDEYLGSRGYGGVERKHFARDDGLVLKALPAAMVEKAKFDKDAGTIRFVMSAEIEDRDRDIVVQAGLDTAQFEKNPVAPWGHQARDMPVGQWSDIQKTLTGRPKRTEGTLNLTKGEPQADRLALHLEAGSIRACSIGFMPKTIERREVPEDQRDSYFYPGYMIHEAELYECSPCSIPANPAALAKAAAEGDTLSREMIEQVLDCWDLKDGLIVPRKAFEDAHRDSRPAKSTVVFGGKTFEVKAGEGGAPVLAPIEPSEAERFAEAIEKEPGVVDRVLLALGLKSKTGEADPKPAEDGKKPAPEPTPEQKLRDQFAKDIPALEARHALLEASAREAALDEEMALHSAA
ncbi:HK97 family phage prohead protease [Methylobacterium radiotolerans]|jgi:HK97 family phage prohead protease|uniref:HK97 family phage prohead protease n=1 Tax=Methylobacterium TaxID=407 RepID=UPI0005E368F2|nr:MULTISPECIES: HK97 family phage prohead protease [Methylobacterium]MBN6821748.1 HK97 family phage prohead protease [Methylobacterium organophilum]OXE40263.1 peptidase [Methylobacterium radiotolerans]GAN49698.1 peptidase U35 phage prohead HK97 [Methylobacterium sp. ME121]